MYELHYYRKDKRWLYWVRSICKTCEYSYHRDYYNINKTTIIEWVLSYKKTFNWKQVSSISNKKRYNLISLTDDKTINIKTLLDIFKSQFFKCKYCKLCLVVNKKHLDHIIPISRWWLHTLTNVQYLCAKCNMVKHTSII